MRADLIPVILLSAVATLGLDACGSAAKVIPTLSISSPSDNATVNVPTNGLVAINFTTDFTLKAPGQCAGQDSCGHVYLLVDSTTCNLPGKPYNALVLTSPAQADLSKCAAVAGSHTITLELHNDDESAVKDLIGSNVSTKLVITAAPQ